MSDAASSRRPKNVAQSSRAPLFEARHEPLPPPPRPLYRSRDPFEDLPEVHPRAAQRRTTLPPAPRPTQGLTLGEGPAAPAPLARSPLAEATVDLHRAQLLGARGLDPRSAYAPSASGRSVLGLLQGRPWLVVLIGVVCLGIILLASAPSRTVISRYGQISGAAVRAENAVVAAAAPETPNGEHSLLGAPTISAEVVDAVLAKYGSPAAGTGRVWVELGKRYGIDPAYALAFFIHESTAGTNPGWAGLKPDGKTTHNIGNIICAGYPTCFGRFRDYQSWEEGIEDWYKLIANEYIRDRNVHTIEQIIPIYAPSFENNVPAYVQVVVGLVDQWRRGEMP